MIQTLGKREKILAVLAIIVVGLALVLRPSQLSTEKGESGYALLTPGLKDTLNDVDEISIRQGEQMTTLHLSESGDWQVKEIFNYPASTAEIRKLLLFLSQSELRDPKTTDPEKFHRIGVDETLGREIIIRREGEVLHHVILGKVATDIAGTYARMPEATQTWLASGVLAFQPSPKDWLHYELFSVDRKRVKRIRFDFKQGKRDYRYERSSPEDRMVLKPLPNDKQLKQQKTPFDASNYFERMKFIHVLEKDTYEGTPFSTVIVETFDGLELRVNFYEVHHEQWAEFIADVRPKLRDDSMKGIKSLEAVRKEAQEINERTRGWLYKLGQFQLNQLTRSYFDIVELK